MKIYNYEKTKELITEEIDLEKGYLQDDKLFVAHHEAVEAKKAVYEDTVVTEENGGISVYKELISPAVEAKEAYDEYEDIQIYVPYTAEETEARKKDKLRARRVALLAAFDKWEKAVLRGREEDDIAIMQWYQDLLDLEETGFENVPERVRYYL